MAGQNVNMLHFIALYGLVHSSAELKAAFTPRILAKLEISLGSGQLLIISDKAKSSPLCTAVRNGHDALAQSLLDWTPLSFKKRLVNRSDSYSSVPWPYVCSRSLAELVGRLIKADADVNALSRGMNTPLHAICSVIALKEGNIDIVKLLCGNGANIHSRNSYGQTPLHRAATYGYRSIVLYLLKSVHDHRSMHIQDDGGKTPLVCADHRDAMQDFSPWQRNSDWRRVPEICDKYSAVGFEWSAVDKIGIYNEIQSLLYKKDDRTISEALTAGGRRWIHFPTNHVEWCD
jgi:ankyrin repeat protein